MFAQGEHGQHMREAASIEYLRVIFRNISINGLLMLMGINMLMINKNIIN